MIQVEGIFAGGGAVTAAPIIGKDFNWSGGDGTYVVLDDGDGNWRIKFLSSGTFTPLKDMVIDGFLVGGGGGPYNNTSLYTSAGGGGYTNTVKSIVLGAGTTYDVTVGAAGGIRSAGGTTSAFGSQALGGDPGTYSSDYLKGGNGGSGGSGGDSIYNGGVDGGNGQSGGNYMPGTGQGTTTREFAETTGDLYSTGGGKNITSTVPNSGNGGTKTWSAAAGIVVIRQHKEVA